MTRTTKVDSLGQRR